MLVQTEAETQLTGESAHIRVFKTANECCKALQTEQWEVYIGSTAELSTSHQSSEELFSPDSKSAVVISATDVPECFLQAAKKTLHAGPRFPCSYSIESSHDCIKLAWSCWASCTDQTQQHALCFCLCLFPACISHDIWHLMNEQRATNRLYKGKPS